MAKISKSCLYYAYMKRHLCYVGGGTKITTKYMEWWLAFCQPFPIQGANPQIAYIRQRNNKNKKQNQTKSKQTIKTNQTKKLKRNQTTTTKSQTNPKTKNTHIQETMLVWA